MVENSPPKKVFSYIVGLLDVALSLITSGSCCITPSKLDLGYRKVQMGQKLYINNKNA